MTDLALGQRRAVDALRRVFTSRVVLGLGVVLAAVYVGERLADRWVPEDDGSFGQMAQRVLSGELPHREFADLYTGGLSFLNAGVFAVFGENLTWLRLPLFVLFLAFLPTVFSIARRFAPTPVAALVVLLAVAWGLPLYPAAMPSWYLLYFATFGTACLLRWLDVGRTRWLVAAGLFGGFAISFKITGVWYVLAALLFLVFVEQESREHRTLRLRLPSSYFLLILGGALAAVGLVASILQDHLGGADVYNLLLPVVAVCTAIVINELSVSTTSGLRGRVGSLARTTVPFLGGVAVPLLVFCIPFVVTGSLGALVDGVLVSPRNRLTTAYLSTPHPVLAIYPLPLVLLFVARRSVRPAIRRWLDLGFVVLAAMLFVSAGGVASYRLIWVAAHSGAPLVLIGGALALLFAGRKIGVRRDRRPAMLLLALSAFACLGQFPYAETIYFCYAVPLVALAALATVTYADVHHGVFPVALLTLFVAFGFVWMDPSPQTLGRRFEGRPQYVVLDDSRASIRVPPADRALYRDVTRLLRQHSAGPYTYAGPDTPEIYYLADLENATRSLFDFLDSSGSSRGDRLLRTLDERGVTAIAVDLDPALSEPHEPDVLAALRARYGHGTRVGRLEVRWR